MRCILVTARAHTILSKEHRSDLPEREMHGTALRKLLESIDFRAFAACKQKSTVTLTAGSASTIMLGRVWLSSSTHGSVTVLGLSARLTQWTVVWRCGSSSEAGGDRERMDG